jgi:hypothetical protein
LARESTTASVPEGLANLGIHLKSVHGPRSSSPLVSIVLLADDSTELEVAATAASLLTSACQDFTVSIVGAPEKATSRTRRWLSPDSRFAWVPAPGGIQRAGRFTFVLHAGTRVGTYSLEALVDAHESTGAALVRVLVGSRNSSAEFWDTAVLMELRGSGDPERAVRASGGERWVSGNSLGLHDYRQPAPRMHLRKGSAGRHDLTILVRDAADSSVRQDYEHRIRELESKLERSETARRRMEAGLPQLQGAGRLAIVARRGPGYVLRRARTVVAGVRNR